MHHIDLDNPDALPIEAVFELREPIVAKLKKHGLTWQDNRFDPPYDVWVKDQDIETIDALHEDLINLRLVEAYLSEDRPRH